MKKITFNKSDWSGEKGSIKLYKNGEFTLYDYRFKLVEISGVHSRIICEEYKIISADGQWDEDFELGRVSKWNADNYWAAFQYDISREDEVKEVAAAKLLCNTI